MLFRKKIPHSCCYCAHGTIVSEDEVLCTKRGVVLTHNKCRKFLYDPCKRTPVKAKPLDFSKYNQEDFSL